MRQDRDEPLAEEALLLECSDVLVELGVEPCIVEMEGERLSERLRIELEFRSDVDFELDGGLGSRALQESNCEASARRPESGEAWTRD